MFDAEAVTPVGLPTFAIAAVEHPLASVTVTKYCPAASPLIVFGPFTPVWFEITVPAVFSQWYVQGAVPCPVAVALPLLPPQVGATVAIVGGTQQISSALKLATGSFWQPGLPHEPEAQSPVVLTRVNNEVPAEQSGRVVICQQNVG